MKILKRKLKKSDSVHSTEIKYITLLTVFVVVPEALPHTYSVYVYVAVLPVATPTYSTERRLLGVGKLPFGS